jgi:hypothetical protein
LLDRLTHHTITLGMKGQITAQATDNFSEHAMWIDAGDIGGNRLLSPIFDACG